MVKELSRIKLEDVQAVYSGSEGDLWELIMGHQIHIGGFKSSMDLAEKANIGKGMTGVDLCSCNGAGVRFLLRFRDVSFMYGVDATEQVVRRANQRTEIEGFADRTKFILGDVTDIDLPDAVVDFVWGEDAWCYVVDKNKLISEAARLVKSGGTIAFTDWIEGPVPMTSEEADRFLSFMKFPNIQDLQGYTDLLNANGCEVLIAENTGRYAPCIDLYLQMLDMQLTSDALRIIGYDIELLQTLAGEMMFIQQLAHANKVIQGLFVAIKK